MTDDQNQLQNKEVETIEASKNKLKPGENGFSLFLLAVGLFFTYHSLVMYSETPGASSYAAVPLFVSVLVVIFSLVNFITDFKRSIYDKGVSLIEKIKQASQYIFPKDVLVIFSFILIYCFLLNMGLGFYIVTPIFLWGSMCYLMMKKYLHNVLWTALSLAFIFIMFSTVFKVVLP
ncbi:tripartite tricarboxylate transporter TctB family protein [Fusibacter ferrireducens]|uniref:Tripartite tricarboxylate transporter TctB family protein n=1 Tax=Fusibacter ferrireducens TaxID=2785058 RepID=A0ABR9ZUZ5_9FIRM|nr:tripartite tricarboxylate transporter TctB family protein [Fusibacter ferrireducens]MBF4694285.1 tripartite tricarboxylate transporter TctB family protein [Fusibacter ferrireducens]